MSTEQTNQLVIVNIYTAFHNLGDQVTRTLQTQLGDAARLREQKQLCLRFLAHIHQHLPSLPQNDREIILSGVASMIEALDDAVTTSSDPPDHPSTTAELAVRNHNRSGPPRVNIDPDNLATLIAGRRVTHTQIARLYGCHPRTIRRRLLEFGLSQPGPPVFTHEASENGSMTRVYRPGSSSDLSSIPNDQLDVLILSIYHQFPSFGRRMIDGYLLQLGHRVPRSRLEASYARVVGPPAAAFGSRRIQRRVYNVAGPMALVHHDGQHGLIRWRIVIHAFVDGYSRFVLGIRASNNNRAQTVFQLFEDIANIHGYPSRVRGDHGTENLLVTAGMEEIRGVERGSYIWGRSVHNIRIERLWVDVTSGFGQKWKELFQTLEASDGLDVNNQAHMWLLHELFLPMINDDAEQWAATWNAHIISRRGERHASPHTMFLEGVLEHGQRSIHPFNDDGDIGNIEEYGIDWQALDDHRIRSHHDGHNSDSDVSPIANPFVLNQPEQLSHVEVPNISCPFGSQAQLDVFRDHLQLLLARTQLDIVRVQSHRNIAKSF
ncbi:hypothetical protein JVT61DRAFT_14953 [Boletus reticuloceps]|uniref:Integrase catalytic domain-containing protein n=1 Tax=Boletus reticuloceps TaxID=495285 RepID=A0A8I3A2R5_9AGAM|nr:hypothetical protein JVT61DRAFT_14953 [Boletus reticuloceps]